MILIALILANVAPLPTTDLTATIGFADARMCTLQPAGERLFKAMADAKRSGVVGRIDGRPVSTRVADRGRRGDTDRVSEVLLPVGSILNGLPVVSISANYQQKAESDSYRSRDIVFDAAPARVHVMMAALGAEVPRTPGYLAIPDPDDIVPGAITIKPKGKMTVLTCGWGL